MPSAESPNKIRLCRVIARLNIGGPAIHVANLNSSLNPQRFSSLLISGIENAGEGSMLDYAKDRGVEPVFIPEIVGEASFSVRDVKALLKLYQVMRSYRPHIVHTHTAKAGFLGRLVARAAGVPVVVHTYHGHVLDGYYSDLKTKILRSMERGLARLSDHLIAVSESVRGDLIRFKVAPSDRISVIPLGFDLEPFLKSQDRRGQFRSELRLNDRARLIGIVGRIFPIKNHALFLEAAREVARADASARFVIVGDGVLRRSMEDRAGRLGLADRVFFTGWRRDLPQIYADLDVLVVSSKNEGTPVSAIEAMASATPVVATRVGGLPDLIEDGQNGYLVTPDNPVELAERIIAVLDDREAAFQMGQCGRVLARSRFGLERLISDMERLYGELLTEKGATA